MIGVAKRLTSRPIFSALTLRREFSVKAIYSTFPATLLFYSARQKPNLYEEREDHDRPDDLYEDRVNLGSNGLVYPGVFKDPSTSNGATMFPNTFMMQEIIRLNYDEALEREDEGQQVNVPFIYTVPKGTAIPSHLILVNEYMSRFSLQPSRGTSLQDLNQALDEFYSKHAKKETADEWLDKHPFQSAIADDADAKWMSM
ncbi:hypothetical protein F4860DRAFT_491446 [Xylaria cubensis]|nr:hypothetical protein F4860DRAFT_491446 [Xylaria cubensis]